MRENSKESDILFIKVSVYFLFLCMMIGHKTSKCLYPGSCRAPYSQTLYSIIQYNSLTVRSRSNLP